MRQQNETARQKQGTNLTNILLTLVTMLMTTRDVLFCDSTQEIIVLAVDRIRRMLRLNHPVPLIADRLYCTFPFIQLQ